MTAFTCTCLRCQVEFTEPLPRVFCPSCRPLFAAEIAGRHAEAMAELRKAGRPVPGDTVRRRTDEDRAFERDIMADLAGL